MSDPATAAETAAIAAVKQNADDARARTLEQKTDQTTTDIKSQISDLTKIVTTVSGDLHDLVLAIQGQYNQPGFAAKLAAAEKDIAGLKAQQDTFAGQKQGINLVWIVVTGAIGAVSGALAVYAFFHK